MITQNNLFWGMQFAPFSHKTALDERSSSISLVSRKNGAKPHRHYFDCRFVQSTNLRKNQIKNPCKSFCYFLLLQKVESLLTSSLRGRIVDSHEASVRSADPHLQIHITKI